MPLVLRTNCFVNLWKGSNGDVGDGDGDGEGSLS